ncbi:MAG: prepilin-type N-terminal cleavage/methylation domain-containing protein [Desulfobacterales bacterium]
MKKIDGFTLIEVIVALTIFAVGLLAVAAMQNSAVKMNSTAGKLTNLATRAMDKIEELSALPYTDPSLDSAENPHQEASGNYTVSWTVIDDNPTANTKNITVTVSGRGKSVDICFLKANL